MTTSSRSRKINIPGSARAGLVLLFMGALIVGLGSYFDRGAISLYGLIIGIGGFLIYIVSSVTYARRNKRTGLKGYEILLLDCYSMYTAGLNGLECFALDFGS